LAAAQARGKKLGSPIAVETVGKARAARSAYAAKANETTRIVIRDIQASGVKTLATIARALQALGIKTPAARHEWRPVQASRVAGGLSRRSRAQTSGRPTCPCATSHCNRLHSLGRSATCLGVGLGLPRHSSSARLPSKSAFATGVSV
jgi:hypothetical protein